MDLTNQKKYHSAIFRQVAKKLKPYLKVSHTVLFLSLFPIQQANASLLLDAQNNLEANGVANNAYEQSINITLHPHADIVGQGIQIVSFGLPVPPGALINTDHVVVVDENGQEIPAFVRSLATWHSMPPESLLCNGYQNTGNPGIRSVLIQFKKQFDTGDIKNFRIDLNKTRQLTIDAEVDVQTTMRLVNDGSYTNHNLGYSLYEPKVITAIEPNYLSCTNLTTLSGEINKNPDMENTDQAQNDFFYTAINEFFGRAINADDRINYVDGFFGYWLYDRPQTFLNAYLRSGNIDQLREGLRAANHYRNEIYTQAECDEKTNLLPIYDCPGFFKPKNTDITAPYKDSKYSYSENLVTAYLLTGDKNYLENVPLVAHAAMKSVNFESDVATERHRANALLTGVIQYELTHDQTILPYIKNAVNQLYQRQHLALEGATVNGCFNYSPEGGSVASFSPWMSSLLANALLRTYQAIGDYRIPGMLVDLAQCEVDRALFRTDVFISDVGNDPHPNMLLPFYIAQSYGEKIDLGGDDPWSSVEHAIDVALPIALGAYFTTDSNQQVELLNSTRDLLKTHDYRIRYWTRDFSGRPLYRLSPPRKYSWQYKNIGSIGWVLNRLDTTDWMFTPSEPTPIDPTPVDPTPIDPNPVIGSNLIPDGQFDNGVSEFISESMEEVKQTQKNPLSGAHSLFVQVDSWSGGSVFTKDFGWDSSVYGKKLKLQALVKVINAATDAKLNICAVAYYQNSSDRFETCEQLDQDSTGVKNISLTLDLDSSEQINRVYFHTRLVGEGPFEFLLDDASLMIANADDTPSEPTPVDPNPVIGSNLIPDGQFDNGVSEFVSESMEEVKQTQENPLSGEHSLFVQVDSWSGGSVFTRDFGWDSGVYGKKLKLKAMVKVINATTGAKLNLCAVTYYQSSSERFETCEQLDQNSTGIKNISLDLDLDNSEQINRVYFHTRLVGTGPFEFLLDDANLVLTSF